MASGRIFLKKHTFYFSEEAIPEENLGEYLKKEKTKAGHATYAHATQTGKGLLFYTKADKTKPSGIVRLVRLGFISSCKFENQLPCS